jgi:regulator of sigma E protease
LLIIVQILIAVLVFGLLIIVHELGHFAAAKATGIKVNGFSIGLGPRIIGKKIGKTDFSIRALPIGGACIMEGEDEDSHDTRAFTNKPIYARFLVLIAGSFMNFLLGFVIILILLSPADRFITTKVESFPAELGHTNNGILAGDIIYKINGERVFVSDNIAYLFERYSGAPYTIGVIRNGEKITLYGVEIEPRVYSGSTTPRYGFNMATEDANFFTAVKHSWYISRDYVRLIRMSIVDLFTGAIGADQLSGPVGITATLTQIAKSNQYRILWNTVAFIAINLAVMNLLPIPALDGGRILFLIIELVMRLFKLKRINPKYENYIHIGGFALFLLLAVYVTYNDIARLIAK